MGLYRPMEVYTFSLVSQDPFFSPHQYKMRLLTGFVLLVRLSTDVIAQDAVPQVYPSKPGDNASLQACTKLKAKFPTNYVDASYGSNYTTKINFNWSTNCDLPAACIFMPNNADQVARGISIVAKAGAKFAVRNGGHNPNVGFASTNGGVLFDMSGLNSITSSSDGSTVTTGSGNTGGALQKYADSLGRSVVTGIDTAPGITGLVTLGGYTHFSQLHGLPTDNVENFEVVLGDASIVNANASHNVDLYRSLRGGGNNFGVVTRLTLRTSQVRNVWYTLYLLEPSNYIKYMHAIDQIHVGMEKDPKANIEILASAQGFQVALWYAEHATTPSIFAPLLEFLPGAQVVAPPTNGTIFEIMQAMSSTKPPMVRMIDSIVHKPDVNLYIALFEELLRQTPAAGKNTDLVLAIKPMGSRFPRVGTERAGGVANSLNMQSVPQVWTSVLAQYEDEKDHDIMFTKLKSMDAWLRTYARHHGDLLLPNLFGNDAGSHQNVISSYGPENVARLKKTSWKYDSMQVFQKLQTNGFLVSRA
ncbi:hypothetical protein ACN47E_004388 [Coniothyrium glycines]